MNKLLGLLLCIFSTNSFSQMYFSTNASMYVKNEILYVDQNINLSSNSYLYLRNNAQFIQGGSSSSTNSGLGLLSLYQEGTSDNFDYNYWCSPVGIPTGATGNGSFGISQLGRPTDAITSTPAVILPAGNYDGIANPLSIASSWIYKLTNANSYSQWVLVGGTSTLAPGEGFTMKGTSGTDLIDPASMGVANNPGGAQRYDFRGRPNNGNITVTLGANNATLTGNPYPSALNLNAFLLDPTNATITGGVAYFWQQDKSVNSHYLSAYRGGYGSYSPMNLNSDGVYIPPVFNAYKQDGTVNPGPGSGTGTSIARRYSPIGQGFLLNGTANGTVTFKNAHRIFFKEVIGSSQFEKPAKKLNNNEDLEPEPISYFRINAMINNQFTRQLALAFLSEATDGVDLGIDALNMNPDLPDDVSFLIADVPYVIQGVNFDQTKQIPILVKATTNATFKFSIPETVNFDTSQAIYIYDDANGSYHNIKNGYYEITLTPGIYKDRFKVTFTNETLGTGENQDLMQFIVYQDNHSRNLKVSNPQNLPLHHFTLYDTTGKAVLKKKDLQTESTYNFITSGLSSGVYIAEFITTDDRKLTKKVIITNSGNN